MNGNAQEKKNELQFSGPEVDLSNANIFSNSNAFNLAARMSKVFSDSTIAPREYQGNPANCMIAVEMAVRLKMSPIMIMQNLYIISGRPAWSSQFIIAMINQSGRYKTELQYEITGKGNDLACYAYAIDNNGRKVLGPMITMEMADKEGWLKRNGSKWQTMPEVMIRYRAASFFGRLNCPDLAMGIYSENEVVEISNDSYSFSGPIAPEPAMPEKHDAPGPANSIPPAAPEAPGEAQAGPPPAPQAMDYDSI